MSLTAATLFSGIGAPEVAMPHWLWPWHAEIERFPSAVMAARHPDSINLGDVSAHDFTERAGAIAKPDVIIFGSPCQSYSIAGRRLGLDDPRGNLAIVALGTIARLEPRWFAFENVPGLLSSSEGRDFGIFLRTVDELGYSCGWASLDAQWFGVAQRRERVFVVGHLGDWRSAAAVLFEPEGLCGHHPPCRETRERIADSLTVGANQYSGFCGEPVNGIAKALTRKGAGGQNNDTETATYIAFSCKDNGADAATLAPTLRAMGHSGSHANAGGQVAVAIPAVAQPLRSNGYNNSDPGMEAKMHIPHVSGVRRLTPRECERLQGFPDDYTLVDYRKKPAADGPRYKALGNSMAVPVMRWILSRIEQVHTQTSA